MTDCPIIFSAPMVRALLAGQKRQTRRVLKPQPTLFDDDGKPCAVGLLHIVGQPLPRVTTGMVVTTQQVRFAIGDRLWVREGWKPHSLYTHMKPAEMPPLAKVFYLADDGYSPSNVPGRPSIHMPRFASRLTLIVTEVKIERLQDISKADVIAEGITKRHGEPLSECVAGWHEPFAELWTSINGPTAWDENPFVVAVSFDVVRSNIDSLPAEPASPITQGGR